MHFALINDKHIEAAPGLRGAVCPGCGAPVIAKCGIQKVNHWAHRNTKMCDSWWETETEWHRAWKNNFPIEWQEVFLPDEQTGEKHIADVRTEHGLVIEFQHSHITPEERIAREKFYKNMVWIVDGTRLQRDYPRFIKGRKDFRKTPNEWIFEVDFPDECFPKSWLESSVPVIFDFLGCELYDSDNPMRRRLHCLFPGRLRYEAVVATISRKAFINAALDGKWSERVNAFMIDMEKKSKEIKERMALEQRRMTVYYNLRRIRRRRF